MDDHIIQSAVLHMNPENEVEYIDKVLLNAHRYTRRVLFCKLLAAAGSIDMIMHQSTETIIDIVFYAFMYSEDRARVIIKGTTKGRDLFMLVALSIDNETMTVPSQRKMLNIIKEEHNVDVYELRQTLRDGEYDKKMVTILDRIYPTDV